MYHYVKWVKKETGYRTGAGWKGSSRACQAEGNAGNPDELQVRVMDWKVQHLPVMLTEKIW